MTYQVGIGMPTGYQTVWDPNIRQYVQKPIENLAFAGAPKTQAEALLGLPGGTEKYRPDLMDPFSSGQQMTARYGIGAGAPAGVSELYRAGQIPGQRPQPGVAPTVAPTAIRSLSESIARGPRQDLVAQYIAAMQPQKARTMSAAQEGTISALGSRMPGGVYDKVSAYAGSLADEVISKGVIDLLARQEAMDLERERLEILRGDQERARAESGERETAATLAARIEASQQRAQGLTGGGGGGFAGGGTVGAGISGFGEPTGLPPPGPVNLDDLDDVALERLLASPMARQRYTDMNTGAQLTASVIRAEQQRRAQAQSSDLALNLLQNYIPGVGGL